MTSDIKSVLNSKENRKRTLCRGTAEVKLDDKNRVVIPAKMREALGEKLIISRDPKGASCWRLLAADEVDHWDNRITMAFSASSQQGFLNQFDEQHLDWVRMALSEQEEVFLDSQNRITLPKSIRDEWPSNKQMLIVGAGLWAEIWEASAFERYKGAAVERIKSFAPTWPNSNPTATDPHTNES